MDLLALDDPVFIIELTAAALERCERELTGKEVESRSDAALPPVAPERLIRAVALLLERGGDPVLLAIQPTDDVEGLDAAARLVRAAAVTGRAVVELATEFGDAHLRELYFGRRLPAFIYEGIDAAQARRLPRRFRSIFTVRRR